MKEEDTTLRLLNEVHDVIPPVNTWVSAAGVTFKLRKVSVFALKDASDKIRDPKPPKYFNADKDVEEENPADPDYIQALADVNYKRGMLAINVIVGLGSAVSDYNGWTDTVDDLEWSDRLTAVSELDIPEKGPARYMAWIKYSGVMSESEMVDLSTAIQRLSGMVQEAEVQEASFPDNEERNTTESSAITPEITSEHRNEQPLG